MKRYLVFAYDTYYPEGGMYDLAVDTDDLEEAKTLALNLFDKGQHVHIHDIVDNTDIPFM